MESKEYKKVKGSKRRNSLATLPNMVKGKLRSSGAVETDEDLLKKVKSREITSIELGPESEYEVPSSDIEDPSDVESKVLQRVISTPNLQEPEGEQELPRFGSIPKLDSPSSLGKKKKSNKLSRSVSYVSVRAVEKSPGSSSSPLATKKTSSSSVTTPSSRRSLFQKKKSEQSIELELPSPRRLRFGRKKATPSSSPLPSPRRSPRESSESDGGVEEASFAHSAPAAQEDTMKRLLALGFVKSMGELPSENRSPVPECQSPRVERANRAHSQTAMSLSTDIQRMLAKYDFDEESIDEGGLLSSSSLLDAEVGWRLADKLSDHNSLERFLLADDLMLLKAICKAAPSTEHATAATSVACIFEAHNRAADLFRYVVSLCIRSISSFSTVFREDTFITKLISVYFKTFCTPYIDSIIGDAVRKVCMSPATYDLLNVSVKDNSRELAKMRALISSVCENIISSVEECPNQIRLVSFFAKQEVCARDPSQVYTALGNLVFLRFFSSAFVTPEAFKLLREDESPSAEARKVLALCSRILQSTVTGIPLGQRNLVELNNIVEIYHRKLWHYLDEIAFSESEEVFSHPRALTKEEMEMIQMLRVQRQYSLEKLYKFVHYYIDDIETAYKKVQMEESERLRDGGDF